MNTARFRPACCTVVALLLIGFNAELTLAAEVEPGASRDDVITALGEPLGTVTIGSLEFLQFERGTVELKDGKVTSSTVVSVAEHTRRVEEQRAQAEARQRQAAIRRADLLREGRAKKEQILAAGSVAARPLEEQISHWQTFSRTYPDVDVSTELGAAKKQLAAENKRKQQELAEAEANREPPPRLSSRRQRKVNRGRHTSGLFDPPE